MSVSHLVKAKNLSIERKFRLWNIYQLIKEVTNFMEQSSYTGANKSSASREIPCILWKQKFHHHIYKSRQPVPILSQIAPVYVPSLSSKIHCNIILPSTSRSSKCFLLSSFPIKTLCALFLHQER